MCNEYIHRTIKGKSQKDIKTIVLAEGEEIRTLKAAEMVKKRAMQRLFL